MPYTPKYVTVQEIRDEGVTEAQANDARVESVLQRVESMIEEATGLWFESRSLSLELDGTDAKFLWFNVPIITITSLKINDDTVDLDTANYRVYNRRGFPQDDRRNPKIELITVRRSVFDGPVEDSASLRIFRKGKVQAVEGTFGWTETDGACPEGIKWCIKRLVTRDFPQLNTPTFEENRRARKIVEEETDGHRMRFRGSADRGMNLTDTFDDPEVAQILQRYRQPLAMSAAGRGWR